MTFSFHPYTILVTRVIIICTCTSLLNHQDCTLHFHPIFVWSRCVTTHSDYADSNLPVVNLQKTCYCVHPQLSSYVTEDQTSNTYLVGSSTTTPTPAQNTIEELVDGLCQYLMPTLHSGAVAASSSIPPLSKTFYGRPMVNPIPYSNMTEDCSNFSTVVKEQLNHLRQLKWLCSSVPNPSGGQWVE